MITYKGDLDIEEAPNESGIYNFWQSFKAPKDADGEVKGQWFNDYLRDAGSALGVAMVEADVFKIVRPEDDPTLKSMETDLDKPFRLGAKIIPDSKAPNQKIKNLQKENTRLKQRIRRLEDKLSKIKNTLPDES